MQIVYYTVLGTHTYVSLIISSYSRHNPGSYNLFNAQLLNVCLFCYLLLKVATQKSDLFGLGEVVGGHVYEGVSVSLEWWNCTYGEYWVLSLWWLVEEIYSLYNGF